MSDSHAMGLVRLLKLALVGGLLTGGAASAQTSAAAEEEVTQIEEIVVTGSRIKRNQLEGPSPVTVITAEQIKREGYATVADALNALTLNTASIQNNMNSGGFTQNASYIDLRGLGPGRTLILIDGRRAADYPLPYNGQSNMVNLQTIPMAVVERVEILSGGASAIYGSDAVAGVVNIILKKDLNEGAVSVRFGDTTEGGGESLVFDAAGGKRFGGLQLTYGFEYADRKPIWAYERDVMDSTFDNPVPELRGRNAFNAVLLAFDSDEDGYDAIDPRTLAGPGACENIPMLELSFVDDPARGYYCGRPDDASQYTIRNAARNASGYLRLSYDISDDLKAWSSLSLWKSDSWYNVGTPFWSYGNSDYYFDPAAASYIYIAQRVLTFEEIGGHLNDEKFDEELLDFAAGLSGNMQLFERAWSWDFTVSTQRYDLTSRVRRLLNDSVEDYFIGQQDGVDFETGFPIHTTNVANFFGPMSRQSWDALTDDDDTKADSSNEVVNFIVSGDLFSLPGGPAKLAAILEYGSQEYGIELDPLISTVAGDYAGGFYAITGTAGGGDRDRFAGGVELALPVAEKLRLSLAARYDKYDDITQVDDALTYNVGFELRPIDSILVRATYATSFRAPDMHFVFAGESGFFTTVTDYYKCREYDPGTPYATCAFNLEVIAGQRSGNPDLEEEEGKSYTAGIIWDATKRLQLSFDYFDIELKSIVNDLSIDDLLETEANCRMGVTEGGSPVNVGSAECSDALARIARSPIDPNQTVSEQINSVTVGAINRAFQRLTGFDAGFSYRHATQSLGIFGLSGMWTHTLSNDQAQFKGDPIVDERDNPQFFDFRSRTALTFTWENDLLDFAVKALRVGSIPNWAETARVNPWTTINASVGLQATKSLSFTLSATNVLDEKPPRDPTFDVYPYFSVFNHDPYGREVFLRAEYKLY